MLEDIGRQLQQARLARRRSLEDLSIETHLKVSHLEALERGDESSLPEPVYIKSFIRKYGQAVGLDAETLANSYWQTRPLPPVVEPTHEFQMPWWVFPWVLGGVLLAGLAALWLYSSRTSPPPAPASPTPPAATASVLATSSVAATGSLAATGSMAATGSLAATNSTLSALTPPAASPSPTAKPTAEPTTTPTTVPTVAPTAEPTARPTPKPTPRPTARPAAKPTHPSVMTVRASSDEAAPLLALRATAETEIAVRRHGVEIFRARLSPDQTSTWPLEDELDVSAVNGGAIELQLGDQQLGTLGAPGRTGRRVFRREDQ